MLKRPLKDYVWLLTVQVNIISLIPSFEYTLQFIADTMSVIMFSSCMFLEKIGSSVLGYYMACFSFVCHLLMSLVLFLMFTYVSQIVEECQGRIGEVELVQEVADMAVEALPAPPSETESGEGVEEDEEQQPGTS